MIERPPKRRLRDCKGAPIELREAAAFYIEQIMLTPSADSYRVLGTRPGASDAELRQNLALLCRWLHSDVCQDQGRSVFFLRITEAWNNLKTPERRAAYDAALDARLAARRRSGEKRSCEATNDHARRGKAKAADGETSGVPGGQRRMALARRRQTRQPMASAHGVRVGRAQAIGESQYSTTTDAAKQGMRHARQRP